MLRMFLAYVRSNPVMLYDMGCLFLMLALLFIIKQSTIPAVLAGILGGVLLALTYMVDRLHMQELDSMDRWIKEQKSRRT